MSTPEDLTPRFRLLIEELGRRLEHKRGWKARVAEQLGVYPPEIPKILNGSRRVGWAVAAKACARLGLDQRFFTDEDDPGRWLEMQTLAADPLGGQPAKNNEELRSTARAVRRATWARPRDASAEAKRLAIEVLRSELVMAARAIADGAPVDERLAVVDLLDAIQVPDFDPADRASEAMAVQKPKSKQEEFQLALSALEEHVQTALDRLAAFVADTRMAPDTEWVRATRQALDRVRSASADRKEGGVPLAPEEAAIFAHASALPGRRRRERAAAALVEKRGPERGNG